MDLLSCLASNVDNDSSSPDLWCEKMCLDGEMVSSSSPFADINSSPLINGLVFNEFVLLKGNRTTTLWNYHYDKIIDTLRLMKFDEESFPSSSVLYRRMEVLCQKNHYPPFSFMRIMVWAQVDTRQVHYLITQLRLADFPYGLKNEKYILSVYDEAAIPMSPLSWAEFPQPVYALAKADSADKDCNDACLLNIDGRIVTTTSGNLYLFIDNNVVGVRYTDGSKRDVIEYALEEAVNDLGLQLRFLPYFTMENIKAARECFVCSTRTGLRVVDGIANIRFYKNESVVLSNKLNKRIHFFP